MYQLSNNRQKLVTFIFVFSLLAPIVFSTIRKLLPSQPRFLEVAASGVVLVSFIYVLLNCKGKKHEMPRGIFIPILIWVMFQLVYISPSLLHDYHIAAIAFMTRVVPIAMVYIAFCAVTSLHTLDRLRKYTGCLAIILVPFGVRVAISGQTAVPRFLQQNEVMFILGKTARAGIPSFAGPFTTMGVLAMTFLGCTYLHMAMIKYDFQKGKSKILLFAGLISSVLLIYLSNRRGAFYAILPGFLCLLFMQKIGTVKKIFIGFCVVLFVGLGSLIEKHVEVDKNYTGVGSRSELFQQVDFSYRFNNIFMDLFIGWCNKRPFGSFVGGVGQIGKMYNTPVSQEGIVEVGGAMLVAETGILGAVLFPLICIVIWLKCFKKARKTKYFWPSFFLLLYQFFFFTLFYFKELSAFTSCTFSLLLFWAIPGVIMGLLYTDQDEMYRDKAA